MKLLNKTNLFGSFMSGAVRGTSTTLHLVGGIAAIGESLVIKGAGKLTDIATEKLGESKAVTDYRDGFKLGESSLRGQMKAWNNVTTTLSTDSVIEDMSEYLEDMDKFLNS